jgi:hypothetical protein
MKMQRRVSISSLFARTFFQARGKHLPRALCIRRALSTRIAEVANGIRRLDGCDVQFVPAGRADRRGLTIHVPNSSIRSVIRRIPHIKFGDDLPQNARSNCHIHLALWWYFAVACRRIVALE